MLLLPTWNADAPIEKHAIIAMNTRATDEFVMLLVARSEVLTAVR